MKKLIYGGLFLTAVGIVFTACEKESVVPTNSLSLNKSASQKNDLTQNSEKSTGNYEEETRSYKWVEGGTKLDCSSAGSGCVVKSGYTSSPEVDLSVKQALSLISSGRRDLNQYFIKNDLSYEFPLFYKSTFFSKIKSGEVNLRFGFPYFQVFDKKGEIIKIYNYESTLSNSDVISMLRAGGYTKAIEFSTSGSSVWKCISDGSNCKVSLVKFNVGWLSNNPKYAYIPTGDGDIIGVVSDEVNNKILIKTQYGNQYGIEL